MKNVLLPTDFSKNSLNAIDYAMNFFRNWECNFYILNVQKISEYISDDLVAGSKTDSIYDSIASDNKKLINELVKKLSKQHKTQAYTFHGLFDYDDFISAVDQAIKFHAIDLIIMGTNGATGANEVLFGSNTLRVIRNISCPTLTIPEHYTFTPIKSAMFSFQDPKNFSLHAVRVFTELLRMHQCELNVLEIDETAKGIPQKKDNKILRKLFPQTKYSYYLVNSIPGHLAVNTAAQFLKVDIHALFVEKEPLLDRLLFGSANSSALYRTSIPLLFLARIN